MNTLGLTLAFLRFEFPGYLALLALIPLLLALSYRSLAGLGAVRRVLAISVRVLVVLVIVLALAGGQRARPVKDLTVIFLMDGSKSIPVPQQRAAFDFVRRAAERRPDDDQIAVVGFAGQPALDQLPTKALALDQLGTPGDPDQTNLAAAVRMGAALLPSDSMGRLVLLSDGNENAGDVLQEAERLRAAGIPIDVVPIQYEHRDEIVFESLKAPPTANTEETINLQMVLRSQRACTGRILLWHNDKPVDLADAARVQLDAGPNRHVLPVPLRQAGAHKFRAQFIPDDPATDTLDDNNSGEAFTVVFGQGKILILTTNPDLALPQPSAVLLQQALERERLVCDVEVAGQSILDQVRLLEYSLVVLDNVPANDIRDEEKKALAVYARDLGGGLIMLGGDSSFGAGGWLGSDVEEVMPVSFDVKHKKQIMRGALVLVMHACEIEKGNYLGERCAIESVKTLSSRDLIGILAWKYFGTDQGHWVVPLQEVGDRARIINAIKQMSMGDLPDLDAVMRPGVEALIAKAKDGPKHMIVISDFDPQGPRDDLIKMMKQNGITCSTVAIGYGAHFINEGLARDIADATGGRFYRTNDSSQLPQIFIKEAREIRRSLVQEIEFEPLLVNPLSPTVPGLSGEALPTLGGYVLSTPKPLADVPLIRKSEEGNDPVLAHWQVGLGKTVAFTSGMWSRWGPHWTAWPKFSKTWAQIVRWASRQAESSAFDVATTVHGGKGKIQIDALDKNAEAINFMEVMGDLILPDMSKQRLQLTQTAPGRYEAEFDARDRGNYIVNLQYQSSQGGQPVSGSLRTGVSVAYSPEYAQLRANLPLLEEVRARTTGRLLNLADPKPVFERGGLAHGEARASIWETLVRWLLVLFLIDVAVRRIAISPAELARKARRLVGEMAGRRRAAEEAAVVLTTLRGARERVREEQAARTAVPTGADSETGPAPTTRFEAPPTAAKATEDLSRALGGATQQGVPVVARPTAKKPAVSEGEYTSRLLKAKKRAREDLNKQEEAPPPGGAQQP
ncbi:MAG: VWA domain-containing protein [Planctomycetota bacterium]